MTKQNVLSRLSPYQNNKTLVTYNQDVKDIIKGIKKTHEQYKSEYDKIADLFVEDNEYETAESIYQFLKLNVPYKAETEFEQTLRSPSAILAYPADCKSYSLFAGGVLDALNRQGYQIPFAYRFANYSNFNTDGYEHVYIVLYPGEDEIILDAVPDEFNVEKPYYIKKDVNYQPMALYKVNGVPAQIKASVPPLNTFAFIQSTSKLNGCGCGCNNGSKIAGSNDVFTQAFQGVLRTFDKNGFFQKIQNLVDGSSGKWKSRFAAMKNLTPKERFAWYYQRLIAGDPCDTYQYHWLYGTVRTQLNDVPEIPLNYAIAWNDAVSQKFGNNTISCGWTFPIKDVMFDLSQVKQSFEDMPNATQVKLLEDVIKGNPSSTLEDAFRIFRNLLNSGQTTYVPPDRSPVVNPQPNVPADGQKNNFVPLAAGALILYKIFS